MSSNTYQLVYKEPVIKFFMKVKENENIITCGSAKETKEKYSDIIVNNKTKRITIFKNGEKISFIDLLTDVKLEKMSSVMNERKYCHIHSYNGDKLFSIEIAEKTNGKIIDIAIDNVMFLLDTNIDFNIAFKLLDEAMEGFKYFTMEDIGVIIEGCFSTCCKNRIVKVVI